VRNRNRQTSQVTDAAGALGKGAETEVTGLEAHEGEAGCDWQGREVGLESGRVVGSVGPTALGKGAEREVTELEAHEGEAGPLGKVPRERGDSGVRTRGRG
jgi:hypothetical protein